MRERGFSGRAGAFFSPGEGGARFKRKLWRLPLLKTTPTETGRPGGTAHVSMAAPTAQQHSTVAGEGGGEGLC